MRRLTLAQRLLLSSAVLLTLMTVTAVTVWVMMGKVVDAADRINQVNVPQLGLIGELELNVTRSSLQLRHAILSRDEQELNTTLQDIAAKKALLQQTLDRFGQDMTDEAGRAAFAPLPALMNTFWQVAEQNVALIVAGQREEAFAFLVDQTIPRRNRLLGLGGDIVVFARRQHPGEGRHQGDDDEKQGIDSGELALLGRLG